MVNSQIKITGTVFNSDNELIVFVNVRFIGKTMGLISDECGNFEHSYKNHTFYEIEINKFIFSTS